MSEFALAERLKDYFNANTDWKFIYLIEGLVTRMLIVNGNN